MGCEHEDGPKCGKIGAGNRADILLDALRSSTLDFPNALSFSVIYEFSMDELTDPDEDVSVLTDVREPSGRYRDGLLITKDGHAVGRTERQRQRQWRRVSRGGIAMPPRAFRSCCPRIDRDFWPSARRVNPPRLAADGTVFWLMDVGFSSWA
jgi:hypothetical protein